MISIYALKPRFQNLLRPSVVRLAQRGVNSYVTRSTMAKNFLIVAVIAGLLGGGVIGGVASPAAMGFYFDPSLDGAAHGTERHRWHAGARVWSAVETGYVSQ